MLRVTLCLVMVIALAALSGCGKNPYQDVIDQQMANWKEMTAILAEVKDPESMHEAGTLLQDRMVKFQEVSRKGSQLPPPDADALKRLESQREPMQAAVNGLNKEIARIKTIPGGQEFFQRFGAVFQDKSTGPLR